MPTMGKKEYIERQTKMSCLQNRALKKIYFRSLNETPGDLYKNCKIPGIPGLKTWYLSKIAYLCKSWRGIRNYSHFHNNLRHFDVLPKFPFTTSETKRNY